MEQQCLDMAQPMLTIPNDPPIGVPNPHQGVSKKTARSKKMAKNAECSVPIEEALKTELTTNNMKTPISVLQELLSRRGITPQYDLIQVEGAVHEPTFRYRVSYKDKDAMGTGKSKKEAKHAAAKALIEKLTGSSFNDYPGAYTAEEKPDVNEEEPTGNPIGWLQEMCMSRRWAPPMYKTETEKGLPHERQFTIACVVKQYQEVGEGKSKKIAKRQAAQKMWQRLQDQPLESNQMMALLDEDGNEDLRQANITSRYAGLMDVSIPTLSKSQSHNVSQFHKTLKSRTGEYLTQLQSLSMYEIVDHIPLLAEIAKEQRFKVTYVDIDEKSFNGMYQCLVQLSTMPVAVCHGSAFTVIGARESAAQHALEYLKIMTKS
uniref:DRBM domain-containing protein n=1 Tax=Anopheles culicifacies TaxID=139723 RepID=A0A182MT42_9DIPT